MRAYERLLNYVKIYTTSDEESGATPSAEREFDLANLLVEELKEIGVENVRGLLCLWGDPGYTRYGTYPGTGIHCTYGYGSRFQRRRGKAADYRKL